MKLLLAENATIEELKLPVLISPKIDGIRCYIEKKNEKIVATSKTGELIPNKHIQKLLTTPAFLHLDGEITVGEPNSYNVFKHSSFGAMRKIGKPKFIFNIFDYAKNPQDEFCNRYRQLKQLVDNLSEEQKEYIRIVPHIFVDRFTMIYRYENEWLKKGYEGIMIRSLSGKYKNGKSTKEEGILLKIKRFLDTEARIIGFEENMAPNSILGALVVKCIGEDICDVPFSINYGFDLETRKKIWEKRNILKYHIIKFKYLSIDSKNKPYFPIFQGMRYEWVCEL